MTNSPVRIFIVEDHDMFREGIRYVLNAHEKFEIIGEASNGMAFLNMLREPVPDIVLMDIDMPIKNGIDTTIEAVNRFPHLKILALSMHGEQAYYKKMIEAGAKGFVLKSSGINQLSEAILEVMKGNVYFSQELLLRIILKNELQKTNVELSQRFDISEREMDVLKLICQGKSNKEIADNLFISVKTVEGHKSKLMLKTETNNTVALVLFAIKNQIVNV